MTRETEPIFTPNPLASSLSEVILNTLEAGDVHEANQHSHRVGQVAINGYKLSYIDYMGERQGPGKPHAWMKFDADLAFELETAFAKYTFGVQVVHKSPIVRSYKSGGIIPQSGGLPDLFTCERALDAPESLALVTFAATPHLHINSVSRFMKLTSQEVALRQERARDVACANNALSADLDALSQARRRY